MGNPLFLEACDLDILHLVSLSIKLGSKTTLSTFLNSQQFHLEAP